MAAMNQEEGFGGLSASSDFPPANPLQLWDAWEQTTVISLPIHPLSQGWHSLLCLLSKCWPPLPSPGTSTLGRPEPFAHKYQLLLLPPLTQTPNVPSFIKNDSFQFLFPILEMAKMSPPPPKLGRLSLG